MENKIFFQEKQRFNQWWLWAILIGSSAFFWWKTIAATYTQGTELIWDNLWIPLCVQVVLIALFLVIKMETKITEQGIQVRFFPFHIKFRNYDWASIKEKTVRTYQPLTEYGGWGIRGLGKNRALNVAGNEGLQLVFLDGKKLLLGTQKGQEIKAVLESIATEAR